MGVDYNLLAGMGRSAAASHQAGLETALVMDRVGRDETTRNVLSSYLQSAPEERETRFNELVAADPNIAANVLTIENARDDRAALQRQQHAQSALVELQAIQKSQNPGLAFRLMAERPNEDNPLRGLMDQLQQQGVINLEDGISDEEAAQITDIAITQLTPIAGMQDERAAPAAIREMEALGYELTPEGFAQYNADRGSPGDTAADKLAVLQAELAMEERRNRIDREQRADEEARVAREKERSTLRRTLRRGLDQTAEIVDYASKLEGTLLQAGIPASQFRAATVSTLSAIGSALGLNTDQQRANVDLFNKLRKNTNDQLITLMAADKLGEGTNSKLQQYQNSLASPEITLGAIMSIEANIADMLIGEHDDQGFEVLDRGKHEANIERWRSYETPAGETVVDIPAAISEIGDFAKATLEQIQSIDIDKLTEKQRGALAKRLDELGL